MSDYRDGCLERKAVRAGIVDQRPVSASKSKPRPVIVECRNKPNLKGVSMSFGCKEWDKWGAYHSEDAARIAIASLERKYSFYDWRLKP